ncbi:MULTISPECIES: restriction endonuclease subunit S [unclassified Campylobacter]|uniref:restriction endonuclease subunit S n=1 Tax=unclassified Campylobacter TaxID=2593542 RepID=UPI003D331822
MSKVNVVWFKDLQNWSIKNNFYIDKIFKNSKYPMVTIGSFLHSYPVEFETLQADKDYKILGVRSYGLGVYHNRIAKGKELITKTTKSYQKIELGNLFWCKVDTKNGAFGVVTDDFIGYYASKNMVQVKIDKSIVNPKFLQYLFGRSFFQNFLDSKITGTTNRQYISFNEMQFLQIPLPPLEIQNKIVNDIENIRSKIKALQEEEQRLKNEIDIYIYIALGLHKKQKVQKQKTFVTRFKDLQRWDLTYNQSVNFNETGKSEPKYPLVRLGEILQEIDTHTKIPSEKEFEYVGLENVEKGSLKFKVVKANSNIIRSNSLILKNGYIYYSKLRPYLKKIFYFKETKLIYASSELVGLKLKDEINSNFVLYLLLSEFISLQEEKTSGARMPRVNLNDIQNFQIPLPPLEIQEKIVADIENFKEQISKAQIEILDLKGKETAVLNSCF